MEADIKVIAAVGPEVITGSTRMKAGTATKMFLNMLSTGAMVKLGKTYGNLMVDLRPQNAKLRDRSMRILIALTNVGIEEAKKVLTSSGGDLKLALVMELCGIGAERARELLATHNNSVKDAVRNQAEAGR